MCMLFLGKQNRRRSEIAINRFAACEGRLQKEGELFENETGAQSNIRSDISVCFGGRKPENYNRSKYVKQGRKDYLHLKSEIQHTLCRVGIKFIAQISRIRNPDFY